MSDLLHPNHVQMTDSVAGSFALSRSYCGFCDIGDIEEIEKTFLIILRYVSLYRTALATYVVERD